MIRIVFICSLISIARSEQCSLNETELHRLQMSFSDAYAYMEQQNRSDAIICLGTVTADKSILINYLMGNTLIAVKPWPDSKTIIASGNIFEPGPEIGDKTSRNKPFTRWTSKLLSRLSIWELPTYGANRGLVTEIANAFYFYELLQKVYDLKVLLVIEYSEIAGDNTQQTINLLRYLETFFGQSFERYFPSITVIFTEAPYEENGYTVNNTYMSELLNKQLLLPHIPDISEACKKFLNYLRQNNNRMGFFREVKEEGDLPSNIGDNILEAIKESPFVGKQYIKNLHPIISEYSKLCLNSSRKNLVPYPQLDEINNIAIRQFLVYQGKVKNYKRTIRYNLLNTTKAYAEQIKALLETFEAENLDAKEGIDLLALSESTVAFRIEVSGLAKNINLSLFIDKLLQLGESEALRRAVGTVIQHVLAIANETCRIFEIITSRKDF